MTDSTKVRITIRFIGVILLTIIGVTIVGMYLWVQVGPENNVTMWLDKTTINQNDPMKLYVRNLGSKRITYGYSYRMFRIYENGTAKQQRYGPADENWAWPAVGIYGIPFGTFSQEIYTDYESGEYNIEKQYWVTGVEYTRRLHFTISD
jgi:hypothetical protein